MPEVVAPWEHPKGLNVNSVRKLAGMLMAYTLDADSMPVAPIFGKVGVAWGNEMLEWAAVAEGEKEKRETKRKKKNGASEASPHHQEAVQLVDCYKQNYTDTFGSPPPDFNFGYGIKLIRAQLEGGYDPDRLSKLLDGFIECGKDISIFPNGAIFAKGTLRDFCNQLGRLEALLRDQFASEETPAKTIPEYLT
jgi:hypothetical protein